MFNFKPFTMDQLEEAAAAKAQHLSTEPLSTTPPARPFNVQAILDLGALIFFHWRGRTYGVPPLPWKRGAALMDAYLDAQSYGTPLTKESAPHYYAALARMSREIWHCTRPTGWWRRALRRLHILSNPFREATEAELAELALFYLGLRMTTHGTRIAIHPDQTPQSLSPMT